MEQASGSLPKQWADGIAVVQGAWKASLRWIRFNGVAISTYFLWQRRVYQAVSERAEVCFAEVPMYSTAPAEGSVAAVIHAGEVKIELCAGADTATVRAIIEALRSC